jgi:hypothetical protein
MGKTQRTPKGHEIPIPKRKDFDAVLNAVAKPIRKPKASRVRRPKK